MYDNLIKYFGKINLGITRNYMKNILNKPLLEEYNHKELKV